MRIFLLASACWSEGLADAQFRLGLLYEEGQGVPQDSAAAAEWWLKAAEQGHSWAQHKLAFAYLHGRGVPPNNEKAVDLFLHSAEQGLSESQFMLGCMYDLGRGVPQEYSQAAFWYRKAAQSKATNRHKNSLKAYSTKQTARSTKARDRLNEQRPKIAE
jgi:TPR repeat protein